MHVGSNLNNNDNEIYFIENDFNNYLSQYANLWLFNITTQGAPLKITWNTNTFYNIDVMDYIYLYGPLEAYLINQEINNDDNFIYSIDYIYY